MTLTRADALRMPLADASVDLIVTSPPYFGQRSYLDGGEHYDGQIGSEATPQDFVEVMLAFLDECWRVLKPTGSCWINLGDKYGGSGAPGTTGTIGYQARNRTGMKSYNQATDVLHKSLMGLPWRFFLGAICPDRYRAPRLVECWHDDERCFACRPAPHPQWIGRAELVWNKPNGLPEILGWSPTAYCTKCDEPRRPIVEVDQQLLRTAGTTGRPKQQDVTGSHGGGHNDEGYPYTRSSATITGYECACDVPLAPTRPAVVLDPFGGTGTTAMVARTLGRYPVSLDLSADYLRLARWRIYDSGHASKSEVRTNKERQGSLL